MKDILKRLVAGESLSSAETEQILIGITKEAYPPEQVTAFIMGIQMRGVTVEEILGLRNGILATGVPVNLDEFKPLDIVGTGGDSKNTFNISTCSCFVVAGAGYKVAKHGNYAATSVSGASNVIEGHGVKFTADEDRLRRAEQIYSPAEAAKDGRDGDTETCPRLGRAGRDARERRRRG